MQQMELGLWKTREIKHPYRWNSSTIANMLTKKEYLGHTVNFKTRKHFKDKKSHYVAQKYWQIFENTQEPIIDEETFYNAQKCRNGIKRYPNGWGEPHPLDGKMRCFDCGGLMYCHRTSNGKRVAQFVCAKYSKIPVGTQCSSGHRINGDAVIEILRETLRYLKSTIDDDPEMFIEQVTRTESENRDAEARKKKERLKTCNRRMAELEKLICKIYEDSVLGKMPESRYETLISQYSKEQTELKDEIEQIEELLVKFDEERRSGKMFVDLMARYNNFDEITPFMVNVADFEMLQSQVKEDGLRVLASDLCRGEAEIYLMTNSLRHAIEYAEFRGGAFDSVYIRMEEQLHKAFVEDLSSYRILATQITDAIRLPDCDSAVLAQEIGGHIIANSSASMESVHHHLQIFVLSFTDYLGSSGTVNASFLSHRRITTKIMRFEREEEMIQRLREILDEIRQQFQRLETAGRQNQILLIRDYVDAHITDPALTVGYVAEQFRAAPSHLTAQFQRYFGVTLYKYIQRERLNHCRALLKSAPSMTVEELAAASGYTDLSTMYRAFKRYEGTTPGALRITCLRGKQ